MCLRTYLREEVIQRRCRELREAHSETTHEGDIQSLPATEDALTVLAAQNSVLTNLLLDQLADMSEDTSLAMFRTMVLRFSAMLACAMRGGLDRMALSSCSLLRLVRMYTRTPDGEPGRRCAMGCSTCRNALSGTRPAFVYMCLQPHTSSISDAKVVTEQELLGAVGDMTRRQVSNLFFELTLPRLTGDAANYLVSLARLLGYSPLRTLSITLDYVPATLDTRKIDIISQLYSSDSDAVAHSFVSGEFLLDRSAAVAACSDPLVTLLREWVTPDSLLHLSRRWTGIAAAAAAGEDDAKQQNPLVQIPEDASSERKDNPHTIHMSGSPLAMHCDCGEQFSTNSVPCNTLAALRIRGASGIPCTIVEHEACEDPPHAPSRKTLVSIETYLSGFLSLTELTLSFDGFARRILPWDTDDDHGHHNIGEHELHRRLRTLSLAPLAELTNLRSLSLFELPRELFLYSEEPSEGKGSTYHSFSFLAALAPRLENLTLALGTTYPALRTTEECWQSGRAILLDEILLTLLDSQAHAPLSSFRSIITDDGTGSEVKTPAFKLESQTSAVQWDRILSLKSINLAANFTLFGLTSAPPVPRRLLRKLATQREPADGNALPLKKLVVSPHLLPWPILDAMPQNASTSKLWQIVRNRIPHLRRIFALDGDDCPWVFKNLAQRATRHQNGQPRLDFNILREVQEECDALRWLNKHIESLTPYIVSGVHVSYVPISSNELASWSFVLNQIQCSPDELHSKVIHALNDNSIDSAHDMWDSFPLISSKLFIPGEGTTSILS